MYTYIYIYNTYFIMMFTFWSRKKIYLDDVLVNFGDRGPQVGIACVGLVERVKDWLVYDVIFFMMFMVDIS
jgi:hypothetical protein